MGCTSSAPNMSEPQHSHTTENEKKEINNDKQDNDNLKQMDTIEKKDPEQDEETNNVECNKIKMLPTCDTLDQNLQLDRKWNTPQHVTNEQERETSDFNDTDDKVTLETNKEIPRIELEEVPSKISTFEGVVDQVVLESILDDIAKIPGFKDDSQNHDKTSEENIIPDNPFEIKNANDCNELDEINEEEDNLATTASPSQSESSRATRWEALADIAAELPPSLAVDPVTGQIYSLTK